MKTNDLLIISTVALGTAALTVLTLWPGTVDAGNDAIVQAKISQPKFLANGLALTLAPANGRVPKVGEAPVFELKAVSLTNLTSSISVRVSMNASSPADALSRAIRIPTVLWADERSFTVGPGETKTISMACTINLPPNKFINVTLQDVQSHENPTLTRSSLVAQIPGHSGFPGSGMVALSFSTVASGAGPVLVTAR